MGTVQNQVLAPGTRTAWHWSETDLKWEAYELENNIGRHPFVGWAGQVELDRPPKARPSDVNRLAHVEANGGDTPDLVWCTTHGAYLWVDDGASRGNFLPEAQSGSYALLSDSGGDDVRDAAGVKFDGAENPEIVTVTGSGTPNRIYLSWPDPEDNELNGEPGGGLRHVELGDSTTKDSVRVVAFDLDGDGVDDSFIVANRGAADQLYIKGDAATPIELGAAATNTYDVAITRLDPSDPTNNPITIVFAKDGVDQYLTLATDTGGAYDPTDPASTMPSLGLADLPGAPNARTHTVKFHTVPAATYGGAERAHLYVGHTQTGVDDPLGQYYHNQGTATGIAALATPTDLKLATTTLATSAPTLLGTSLALHHHVHYQPPAVVFGTAGGTQVVVSQHDLGGGQTTYGTPLYDGTGGNHKVQLLQAGGGVETLDPTAGTDEARDLEAAGGLLLTADFDGNGHPDVLSGLFVVLSDENGRFDSTSGEERLEPHQYFYGPPPLGVVAFDYDGDGDLDIVVLTEQRKSEGEWDAFLVQIENDGTGVFGKRTQTTRNGANADTITVARGTNRQRNYAYETPRMITFNEKLAIAQGDTSGVVMHHFDTTTQKWNAGGGNLVQRPGYPLDMKTALLNGNVGSGGHAAESIMAVTDGASDNVCIFHWDTGSKKRLTIADAQRIAAGNILGDARAQTIHEVAESGRTNNAGVEVRMDRFDPRSLDVVVVTTTNVQILEGAFHATDSVGALSSTPVIKHTFVGGGARTVTSVDVHDMDGNGYDDIVLSFSGGTIYRSILYVSAPATIANPTLAQLVFEEKALSPNSDGVGTSASDTADTRRLIIEDFDRDGNMDLVYVNDENHPARVTYARPPGDTAPQASEQPLGGLAESGADLRSELLTGMVKWVDDALVQAFADGTHQTDVATHTGASDAGHPVHGASPGRGQINDKTRVYAPNSYFTNDEFPESYKLELTNGDAPVPLDPSDPKYVKPIWMAETGDPAQQATYAMADYDAKIHCRAPSEPVLPVTLSFQLDFPTVPCKAAEMANYPQDCILPTPLAATKGIIPTAAGGSLPLCSVAPQRIWRIAHKRNPSPAALAAAALAAAQPAALAAALAAAAVATPWPTARAAAALAAAALAAAALAAALAAAALAAAALTAAALAAAALAAAAQPAAALAAAAQPAALAAAALAAALAAAALAAAALAAAALAAPALAAAALAAPALSAAALASPALASPALTATALAAAALAAALAAAALTAAALAAAALAAAQPTPLAAAALAAAAVAAAALATAWGAPRAPPQPHKHVLSPPPPPLTMGTVHARRSSSTSTRRMRRRRT